MAFFYHSANLFNVWQLSSQIGFFAQSLWYILFEVYESHTDRELEKEVILSQIFR